jgi:antitoxin component YwqK of YwqJK toxin-antitoxin module
LPLCTTFTFTYFEFSTFAMKHILTIACCLCVSALFAQKKEVKLDYSFRPAKRHAYYTGTAELKGDKWYRELYYTGAGLASTGWYKDEELKIPDGELISYHPNNQVKSKATYVNGKRHGVALSYNSSGKLTDSANYRDGHQVGVGLGWNSSGAVRDSSFFDGNGNGTRVNFLANGKIGFTGRIINDTTAVGSWKYYHSNGNLLAVIEYGDDGKRISSNCYTETGEAIDPSLCVEREAEYKGGEKAWRRFLEKNLNANVPVKKRAPVGHYTVAVRFIVDKEGNVTEPEAITNVGYGMEEELIRLLRIAPRWEPARQYGRVVNAYRIQPLTFVVELN